MDVSSIASTATTMMAAQTGTQLDMAVLKKMMDIETQGIMTLLNALPQASNLPSHLGQNVNTTA